METPGERSPKSKIRNLKSARRIVMRQVDEHIPYISGWQIRDDKQRERWVHQVTAWEPIYLKGIGNACRMLLGSREVNAGATSGSIYRSMASRFCASIEDLRGWYVKCHSKSQSVPLPVASRELVFFAVKTRMPRGRNDGAVGYIANTAVQDMEPLAQRRTRIYIVGNHYIDAEMSIKNVRAQRLRAELFQLYLALEGVTPNPLAVPGRF